MSKYADNKALIKKEVKLSVKDTDFLLKLIDLYHSFCGEWAQYGY